jgi:hypothetical protein
MAEECRPMTSTAEELIQHMRRECSLLIEFHDAETEMRARIHEKDLDGLQVIIESLMTLADELVETENARHRAFEAIKRESGEPDEATFYQVVVHLREPERNAVTDLYRTMKFSVFGIQAVSVSVDEQVRSLNDTMHAILGELYPHRKGNLYSKSGAKLPNGTNPLLIDREL